MNNSEPTTNELIAAGINPAAWADPESWDDKEYAFYWRREAERLNRLEADARAAIANHFQWPGCWSELLPRILAMRQERDALKADAARLDWLAEHEIIEGFANVPNDLYDYAAESAAEWTANEPSKEDYRKALRLLIDEAMKADGKQ